MLCACGDSYFLEIAAAGGISEGGEGDRTVAVDGGRDEVQTGGRYNKTEKEVAGTGVLGQVEKKQPDQAFPMIDDVALKGIAVQVVGERLIQSQRSLRSAFWSREECYPQAFQRMQDDLTLLNRLARLVQ